MKPIDHTSIEVTAIVKLSNWINKEDRRLNADSVSDFINSNGFILEVNELELLIRLMQKLDESEYPTN